MLYSISPSPTVNIYDVVIRLMHHHGGEVGAEQRPPAKTKIDPTIAKSRQCPRKTPHSRNSTKGQIILSSVPSENGEKRGWKKRRNEIASDSGEGSAEGSGGRERSSMIRIGKQIGRVDYLNSSSNPFFLFLLLLSLSPSRLKKVH